MIDRLKLANRLTGHMIQLLHYQEHGEPAFESYAEWSAPLPEELIERYRNEPKFHAQVQRAVATILDDVREAERAADSAEGSR